MQKLTTLSFELDQEDPQDVTTFKAYARIAEYHVNAETGEFILVVNCWRSEAAYLAGKNISHSFQLSVPNAMNILYPNDAWDNILLSLKKVPELRGANFAKSDLLTVES